jgi:hypothetical protein
MHEDNIPENHFVYESYIQQAMHQTNAKHSGVGNDITESKQLDESEKSHTQLIGNAQQLLLWTHTGHQISSGQ